MSKDCCIKVMHLLTSNSFSGAENVVCQIIDIFRKSFGNKYEMVYVSPKGPIGEILNNRGVSYFGINKLTPGEVRKAIDEIKPDIVHAHDMRASVVASMSTNLPIISHIHNNNFNSRKISAKSVLYYLCSRKYKHIFWVSKAAFEGFNFHSKLYDKSTILYNVIDGERIELLSNEGCQFEKYDIVYLGRLTYPKNPERLIGIIEKVYQEKNDLKVAIIGNGELFDDISKLIKEKELSECIDMLGFQNNPFPILKNAKVLLMSSRWEGTPMCVLEALSLGIPIVSTPADGIAEVISDGVDGYLSDKDELLAKKALEIINNEKKFSCMSIEAKNKFDNINDIDAYAEKLRKTYEEVCRK